MKPIILKVKEDNKIVLTAEEIESMINDAYKQGYEDGKRYFDKHSSTSEPTQCRNPYDVA